MWDSRPAAAAVTRDADMICIAQHSDVLAELAWEGYTCLGRGIVVIDHARTNELGFIYLDHNQIAQLGGSAPVQRLLQYIRQYDPLREVLCLMVRSECAPHAYRWSLTERPVRPALLREACAA